VKSGDAWSPKNLSYLSSLIRFMCTP